MITHMTKKIITKVVYGFVLSLMLTSVFVPTAFVFAQTKGDTTHYTALTTIPGLTEAGKVSNPIEKVKNIYGVSIGIAAVLAVIMIIWAGIEYATAEAITGKSDAKQRLMGVASGLGLLLGAYLLLRTINIDLVNINLDLGKVITDRKNLLAPGSLEAVVNKAQETAKQSTENTNNSRRELEVEKNKLQETATRLEKLKSDLAKFNIDNPNSVEEQQQITNLIKEIADLEAVKKTQEETVSKKTTETQIQVANATIDKNYYEVVNLITKGEGETAEKIIEQTNKAFAKQMSEATTEEQKKKIDASMIIFNSLVEKEKSINDIYTFIEKNPALNIKQAPNGIFAYAKEITDTYGSILTDATKKMAEITSLDKTQAELYRSKILTQQENFRTVVGKKIGCPGQANIPLKDSGDPITCR